MALLQLLGNTRHVKSSMVFYTDTMIALCTFVGIIVFLVLAFRTRGDPVLFLWPSTTLALVLVALVLAAGSVQRHG